MRVFVTGASGTIGYSLVKELLKTPDVDQVGVLLRSVNDKIELLKSQYPNLMIYFGDIKREDLGLSTNDIKQVFSYDEIFHSAATTDLSSKAGSEINETNVRGTINVLNYVKNSRLYHISSAYACGLCSGMVQEDWLKKPESFRNPYEDSKWRTEAIIRKAIDEGLDGVILRTGVVTHSDLHSKHSIYGYADVLDRLSSGPYTQVVGSPKSTLNLIPLENVIQIIKCIRADPDHIIYNITASQNTSLVAILRGIGAGLNRKFEFVDPEKLNDSEKKLARLTSSFHPYVLSESPIWTRKNIEEFNIPEPDENWYEEHIEEYLKNKYRKNK